MKQYSADRLSMWEPLGVFFFKNRKIQRICERDMRKVPMTMGGAERLRAELNELKTVKRPAIIQAIAEAREHGDLRENAEYMRRANSKVSVRAALRRLKVNWLIPKLSISLLYRSLAKLFLVPL